MKTSEKIKQRLQQAKARFWANDNIADFMDVGDKQDLIDEVAKQLEDVLDSLVIDRETDPNSMDTPRRIAKMYIEEIMSGRYEAHPKVTAFPNDSEHCYDGMLVVRAEIKSICSHHHQPVTGVAYIGVIPDKQVIGLSKYVRIAQWCARRGTLQEELANDIAREIRKATEAKDVGVHIGGEHGCCTNRGIMAASSLTQTTVLFGAFKSDPSVKKEFFDNIGMQKSTGSGSVY